MFKVGNSYVSPVLSKNENSVTKTMINEYYITESAIIKRVYSVKAHSVEEAKEKFNKEGGNYLPPTDESEDVDGSHQIEDVELYEENIDNE